MTIIDFNKYKAENSPHLSGSARCIGCKHEWIAVTPIGTINYLECPNCGAFKGALVYPCVRENIDQFECNCGSNWFSYHRDNVMMCINCGTRHEPWNMT